MKNQSLVYRTRCNQKTPERNKGASKYRTMSKYPEYTEKPTVRNKLKGCRDQKMGHPLTDTSSEAEIGQLQEPLYGTLPDIPSNRTTANIHMPSACLPGSRNKVHIITNIYKCVHVQAALYKQNLISLQVI